jgi:hypothetical protein
VIPAPGVNLAPNRPRPVVHAVLLQLLHLNEPERFTDQGAPRWLFGRWPA